MRFCCTMCSGRAVLVQGYPGQNAERGDMALSRGGISVDLLVGSTGYMWISTLAPPPIPGSTRRAVPQRFVSGFTKSVHRGAFLGRGERTLRTFENGTRVAQSLPG